MPVDASIYQNVKPTPINIPSPLDTAEKAMQLGQIGMQQMQMARQMQQQSAIQSALMHNTDPTTGQLDQGGYLGDLGKMNPMAAQQEAGRIAAQNEAVAKSKAQTVDTAQKIVGMVGPSFDVLKQMPTDQRAAAYPSYVQQLKAQGVDVSAIDHPYDDEKFNQYYNTWQNNKQHFEALASQADIAKTQGEAAEIPGKIAKNQAETAKTISETYGRPQVQNMGQSDDPAVLVPNMVPKDHQAKAFEEIKNAGDIKTLTPRIIDAFNMGTSKNPIIAAQGQKQFEGLINTTVKEEEGTARQAAFESIHKNMSPSGLTALPGENESKLSTIMSYLQSKADAPTSRAYGIDLSKFARTSPYQPPQKSGTGSPGGLGEATANASEAVRRDPTAPDPRDQSMIKALGSMDASSQQAFKLRAILKAKGLLK
jgi:hypothetical protein